MRNIKNIIKIVLTVSIVCFLFLGKTLARNVNWTWPRSTAEKQQLGQERLNQLIKLIQEGKRFPDIDSLLIVKNGYLVHESYFSGYTADRPHTLQSVSKSITSALIGIALEQKQLYHMDESVLDFFPNMTGFRNLDKRKRAMTLKDLMTMRSGTDYHERGPNSPHFRLNDLQRGWTRFYLNRKMVSTPGTRFQYDSGAVILLSSILKSRTGMHADAFARKYLFDPLLISGEWWYKNREGHPHTGGGLHMKPRDMAKFGLLYLQRGRWGNRQLIPESWVQESFKLHVRFKRERNYSIGYGYLWWILKPDPDGKGQERIYAAMGHMGQYIFIVPEHRMVVVVTGSTTNGYDQRNPIRFLYNHILKAIKSKVAGNKA